VQDSSGGFDTAPNTFRFDVTPANDAPVAVNDSASTNEDAALTLATAALLANDSDVDGDTLTIASVQGAVNGRVALVGGNVVFTPAANYNGPASFTYTVIDGNGGSSTATVNLTISAVGDAAVISSGAGSVTEDVGVAGGNLSTGGTLTITDPDAGEANFQAQAVNGAYGSFALAANGAWAYTALNTNPAIQALGTGDTLTETFTVTSADGTTSSVVVTINGTNDAAVISAGTGSVTEDVGVVGGNIATGGTLTISDADSGEASFTAQTTAGTYGSFTLGTNGVWTYSASNTNPAIQALGAGDTLTETFTVTSADGTTSSVVVTINGTNDAAVISAGTGSVTEDVGVVGGNIATGGTLTISDADSGEASFTAQTTAGTYGSFVLAANGVWTYTAANTNPAIQALGTGDTLTETFTVTSADGTTWHDLVRRRHHQRHERCSRDLGGHRLGHRGRRCGRRQHRHWRHVDHWRCRQRRGPASRPKPPPAPTAASRWRPTACGPTPHRTRTPPSKRSARVTPSPRPSQSLRRMAPLRRSSSPSTARTMQR
jgi:VCBS repeat-containing protein